MTSFDSSGRIKWGCGAKVWRDQKNKGVGVAAAALNSDFTQEKIPTFLFLLLLHPSPTPPANPDTANRQCEVAFLRYSHAPRSLPPTHTSLSRRGRVAATCKFEPMVSFSFWMTSCGGTVTALHDVALSWYLYTLSSAFLYTKHFYVDIYIFIHTLCIGYWHSLWSAVKWRLCWLPVAHDVTGVLTDWWIRTWSGL